VNGVERDTVTMTVKAIKITPKKGDYTVVLDKYGHPPPNQSLTFDIEGPPNWIYDVQLQRVGSNRLTGEPVAGLDDSWLETTASADRPQKNVYSSFTSNTTGTPTRLESSGKAAFTVPFEWWRDQARRKVSDFSTLNLYYRVVVVSDAAGSI